MNITAQRRLYETCGNALFKLFQLNPILAYCYQTKSFHLDAATAAQLGLAVDRLMPESKNANIRNITLTLERAMHANSLLLSCPIVMLKAGRFCSQNVSQEETCLVTLSW